MSEYQSILRYYFVPQAIQAVFPTRSEKMLEIAQKKLENRATLILGDSEQLPFSDCFFDVVYCNDSFHHYPAPERVLSEIDRVLKPNGTFILCDCWQPTIGRAIMNFYMKYSKEGDVKIYSESEICKLLSRHFSNVTWERVGNTARIAVSNISCFRSSGSFVIRMTHLLSLS
mgnify:CR=1 FL=1